MITNQTLLNPKCNFGFVPGKTLSGVCEKELNKNKNTKTTYIVAQNEKAKF